MSIAAGSDTHVAPKRRRSQKSLPPKEPNSSSQDSTTSTNPASVEPEATTLRYVVRRKMRVNGTWLMPGEEVPQAHEWPRVESMVRAGFLNEEWR